MDVAIPGPEPLGYLDVDLVHPLVLVKLDQTTFGRIDRDGVQCVPFAQHRMLFQRAFVHPLVAQKLHRSDDRTLRYDQTKSNSFGGLIDVGVDFSEQIGPVQSTHVPVEGFFVERAVLPRLHLRKDKAIRDGLVALDPHGENRLTVVDFSVGDPACLVEPFAKRGLAEGRHPPGWPAAGPLAPTDTGCRNQQPKGQP